MGDLDHRAARQRKDDLAERVTEAVAALGMRVKLLGVATVRRFLLQELPAPESQQEVAHRALAYATKLLTEAGVAVIVDATAPRRAWREAARKLIPGFAEVQLVCPADICVERERAARWRLSAEHRARPAGGGPPTRPDIVMDYEESLRPDLVLHTDRHDIWSTVEQALFLIHRLRRTALHRAASP